MQDVLFYYAGRFDQAGRREPLGQNGVKEARKLIEAFEGWQFQNVRVTVTTDGHGHDGTNTYGYKRADEPKLTPREKAIASFREHGFIPDGEAERAMLSALDAAGVTE